MPEASSSPDPKGATTSSSGGASASKSSNDVTNTPGVEIPKTAPDPKAEFEPNFIPPITHDLRTIRRETAAAEALRPVDPNADGGTIEKLVTITERGYEQLKTLEDFRILAVAFQNSEIPAAELLPLVRAFNEATEDPDKIDAKIKSESAQTTVPISTTIDQSSDQPKSRLGLYLKILGDADLLMVLFLMAFAVGYVKGNRPIERAESSRAQGRRGYYPTVGGWNIALNQLARGTQKKVIWLTTDPMAEPYTWDIIGALTKQGRQVDVVAICPPILRTVLINLARLNRATLYLAQVEIYRIHQAIIDNHIIL